MGADVYREVRPSDPGRAKITAVTCSQAERSLAPPRLQARGAEWSPARGGVGSQEAKPRVIMTSLNIPLQRQRRDEAQKPEEADRKNQISVETRFFAQDSSRFRLFAQTSGISRRCTGACLAWLYFFYLFCFQQGCN